MINSELNGEIYYNLLLGGYENLFANRAYVDALNVFPVPDGDTGRNMGATMQKGVANVKITDSISALAKTFAKCCLFSARGNSGVILSQFFNGISKYLQSINSPSAIDTKTFAFALYGGYKQALSSVSKPVEGTMLTVMRDSAEYLLSNIKDILTFGDLFEALVLVAKKSLINTPNLLSVLKDAGVVDAGGAGILCIFEGMQAVFEGRKPNGVIEESQQAETKVGKLPSSNYVMQFGYCTEFILQLLTSNGESFDKDAFVDYLHTIGNSIVAVVDEDVVKVHVHTFTPEKVLEYARKYGELISIKIENMDVQQLAESVPQVIERKHIKNAVVAVANGAGVSQYFTEIGATYIINAGQTQNPSAEDFIEAFKRLDAENVIVLPNNKNIILAAKQAQKLYKEANVFVIETTSLAEGYSALSMMDATLTDVDKLIESMKSNLQNVTTGLVACANRDTTINGVTVKNGEFVGIAGSEILCSEKEKNDAVLSLLKKLPDIDEKETIVIFVGEDVTKIEKEALEGQLEDEYPLYDIAFIDGKQPIYSYVLSIE